MNILKSCHVDSDDVFGLLSYNYTAKQYGSIASFLWKIILISVTHVTGS